MYSKKFYEKNTLIAFVWVMLAEAAVVALVMLIVMDARGSRLTSMCASKQRTKELLRDGWPFMLSSLAVVLYMKIDQIMLGQMINDEAVGIYSAAVRISEVWYFVPMVIASSVFPKIIEAKELDINKYEIHLQRLYDVVVWLCIVAAIVFTCISTPLAEALYGTAYSGVGLILSIHVWAGVSAMLLFVSGKWLIAENLGMYALARNVVGLAVNIIMNILFIPQFGGVGAAFSTLVSYLVAGFALELFISKARKGFFMKREAFNLYAVFFRLRIK